MMYIYISFRSDYYSLKFSRKQSLVAYIKEINNLFWQNIWEGKVLVYFSSTKLVYIKIHKVMLYVSIIHGIYICINIKFLSTIKINDKRV